MNDSAQEESKSRIEAEQASHKRDMPRSQTEEITPSKQFGVSNRRGATDGDELDEIKEEHSDR